VTAHFHAAGVRAAVEGLLRQRVDAIVLVVVDSAVLEAVRALDLSIPLVAAASTARRSPRIVSIDQYRGARSAVRHLAELGHTRILHLAGPPTAPDAAERVRGWRDELSERRLEIVDPVHGDWSAASGYRLGLELEAEPGSALFVGNDHMAIGVLSALRERGIRVPEDVSIVGSIRRSRRCGRTSRRSASSSCRRCSWPWRSPRRRPRTPRCPRTSSCGSRPAPRRATPDPGLSTPVRAGGLRG